MEPHQLYACVWNLMLFFCTADGSLVEVSFENLDAGYFLKPTALDNKELFHQARKFTVVHPSQLNTVKVSYGPFTAKQTVPVFDTFHTNQTVIQRTTLFELSAHVVTKEVRREQPLLRVLFHLGIGGRDPELKLRPHSACITLIAEHNSERLTTTCIPTLRDGTCLGEITVPTHWWPPLDHVLDVKLKNIVHLEYILTEGECSSLFPNIPNRPRTRLEDIFLSNIHGQYNELKQDEVVRLLEPQGIVYPRSRIYVPVYIYPNPAYPVHLFLLRAKVRNGLRILGAQASQTDKWTIIVDTNAKQTIATVTAFMKDISTVSTDGLHQGSQEVFSWLLEVDENASFYDSGRITWNVRYVLDTSSSEQYNFDDNVMKMISKVDIQKDDIQAVLPIAKSWTLMNTAILNGKQVSQSMKVYIVSQAGKVADVTIQSSCRSADDSILKVSSSCTSVYLDGSEIRGSHNASIIITYGSYTGQAHFTVWVPELPLEIQLTDAKLSQIKGWKVPQFPKSKSQSKFHMEGQFSSLPNKRHIDKSSQNHDTDGDPPCPLRFQQTSVEVYARFFCADENSGRESYFLNRKSYFGITDLVQGSLRIADTRIADLRGRIVQGQSVGRTEIQVLSPVTGRVIGAREVRVGNDKVTVEAVKVTVVTGLQLSIEPADDLSASYIARTSVSHTLTAQYQEGLLDIQLQFSDDTSVHLAHVPSADYYLQADTFDKSVVAFAPKVVQHHPRVIAVGEGKGDLLLVTIELSQACQRPRLSPIATSTAYVDVDLFKDKHQGSLQNDGHGFKGSDFVVKSDGFRQSNKILLSSQNDKTNHKLTTDTKFYEPTVQARQNIVLKLLGLTPLEIGMYSLLSVFCIAIIMFVISCAIYAVHFTRKQVPAGIKSDSVSNAHDWVWLGRATTDQGTTAIQIPQKLSYASDLNNGKARTIQAQQLSLASNNKLSCNLLRNDSHTSLSSASKRQTDDSAKESENKTMSDVTSVDSDVTSPVPESQVRILVNPTGSLSSVFGLSSINGSATFVIKKPPIPPHACLNEKPVVKQRGVLIDTVQSYSSISQILGPICKSDAEWESVTMGMNYDQLTDYFDNLKESNA